MARVSLIPRPETAGLGTRLGQGVHVYVYIDGTEGKSSSSSSGIQSMNGTSRTVALAQPGDERRLSTCPTVAIRLLANEELAWPDPAVVQYIL